ncbi:MAG: T9SS type A sorting domain-containing protein [Flavobacteriales bacterium]|nr:T9SS type A sorting domain-containing protein [Flavobacteriales bacterium]
MKKLLHFALIALLPVQLLAQEPVVILTNEEGEEVNETLITVYSAPWEAVDTVSLFATLTGGVDRTVNLRRYEVDVVTGTRNFFCWGVCYTSRAAGVSPVWESAHPVYMTPGVPVNNFHAYYRPEGIAGGSLFRFVWFDMDNMNDSTWVDILFDSQVGIDENAAGVIGFETFPNPALDAPMNIRVTLDPSVRGAELVVYNALGSKVHREPVRGTSNTVVLQRDQFQPGVYFANLEVAGRALITRRLVIGSR